MKLGDLSARYESNGDPGAIAHTPGDLGGASYGAYQFATASGVPQAFIQFCVTCGYANAQALVEAGMPGTDCFDGIWESVAQGDPEGFLEIQWQYVKASYFDVAMAYLRDAGWDFDSIPDKNVWAAISQIIWSAAVQYGPKWVPDLFNEAEQAADIGDPHAFIQALYAVRSESRNSNDWISTSNPENIVEALRNRFASECQDALVMLG